MSIRILLLMVLSAVSHFGNAQSTVGGVAVKDSFTANSQTLVLNGAGVRKELFVELYVAALYLSSATSDAQAIINADTPMAIRLHITSGLITSNRMAASTEEGFKRSLQGRQEAYRSEIDRLISAFSEEISKGDIFDIIYLPESGIVIEKNGQRVTGVEGLDFKKALWGIWLGDDPVDRGLKAGLLGS